MENMFEKGCLVQLSISKWGGVKKINDNQLAEMIDSHEWVTATKKLVDPRIPQANLQNGKRSKILFNHCQPALPHPGNGLHPKRDDLPG